MPETDQPKTKEEIDIERRDRHRVALWAGMTSGALALTVSSTLIEISGEAPELVNPIIIAVSAATFGAVVVKALKVSLEYGQKYNVQQNSDNIQVDNRGEL